MTLNVDRFRFLTRDNATVFDAAFDKNFTTNQLDVIHTPPGAPHANATAERFVRTARTELLDHYNGHRPHRGINQRSPTTIDHPATESIPIHRIRQRPVVGGLINEYHPAA